MAEHPDAPQSSRTFSGKTAAFHGLLGFLVSIGICAGIAAANGYDMDQSERLGRLSGPAVLLGVLATVGASYLLQRGKRGAGLGVLAAAPILVAGLAWTIFAPRGGGTPLTRADRAELVTFERSGAPWLKHAVLPIELPHPGEGFEPSAMVAEQTFGNQGDSSHGWGWMDKAGQRVVALGLQRASTPYDAGRMRGLLNGFWSGFSGAAEDRGVPVQIDHQADGADMVELHGSVGGMVHLRMQARALSYAGGHYLAVLVATGSDVADVAGLLKRWEVGKR